MAREITFPFGAEVFFIAWGYLCFPRRYAATVTHDLIDLTTNLGYYYYYVIIEFSGRSVLIHCLLRLDIFAK